MKARPSISVIVPVYNVEKYLARCVDSILRQTFQNFEVILVNDCSPDESAQICDEFAKKDERVSVIHLSENQGLSGARNAGLKMANGEFLSFVDSDDWIPDNFLQVLHQGIAETGCDISACGITRVWERHDIQEIRAKAQAGAEFDRYSTEEALIDVLTSLRTIGPTTWNKLYRRSLFDTILFPVGVLHEDALTTYKLVNRSKMVCFTSSTTYYYFQSHKSIMRGKFNTNRLKAIPYVDEVFDVVDMSRLDTAHAATFYKYAFYVGLIDDMLGQPQFKLQRRELMDWMLKNRGTLLKNMYASWEVKASLLILDWPFLYEQLKMARNSALKWLIKHRSTSMMSQRPSSLSAD